MDTGGFENSLRLRKDARLCPQITRKHMNSQAIHRDDFLTSYPSRSTGSDIENISRPGCSKGMRGQLDMDGTMMVESGDKLAFAEVTDEAHAEIWIADGDASGRLNVHSYALEFSDPSISLSMAWSPDGRRLLFGTNSGTFQGPIWMAVFERQ